MGFTLHNEDCLTGMNRIADGSIDLILTDLPYGVTDCAWDKVLPMDELFRQYNRIISDHGAIILTATQPFATDLINANRKCFRYDIVWEKNLPVGFANSHKMPLRSHELILVFYKHLPTYNPQGLLLLDKPKVKKPLQLTGKDYVYDMNTLNREHVTTYTNYPRSVIRYCNVNYGNVHPTQKPLDLFEYLILTYTNIGDTVLDSCMGSGTTGVACKRTGRNFVGFETDERYFEIARDRIENAGSE